MFFLNKVLLINFLITLSSSTSRPTLTADPSRCIYSCIHMSYMIPKLLCFANRIYPFWTFAQIRSCNEGFWVIHKCLNSRPICRYACMHYMHTWLHRRRLMYQSLRGILFCHILVPSRKEETIDYLFLCFQNSIHLLILRLSNVHVQIQKYDRSSRRLLTRQTPFQERAQTTLRSLK